MQKESADIGAKTEENHILRTDIPKASVNCYLLWIQKQGYIQMRLRENTAFWRKKKKKSNE